MNFRLAQRPSPRQTCPARDIGPPRPVYTRPRKVGNPLPPIHTKSLEALVLSDDVVQSWLDLLRVAPESAGSGLSAACAALLVPLATEEQVLPWYWHQLRRTGLSDAMSSEVRSDLRRYGIATTSQRLNIEVGTLHVVRLLRAHGIDAVLLKGVAYAALAAHYPFLPFRQTGDADLLVPPGEAQTAWNVLLANGFQRENKPESVHHDHHHLPLLVGPNGVQVEIHAAASLFVDPETSWQRFGERAERVVWRGIEVLVPARTELLWHAIVHSLGDGADGCRLRHLLTTAALLSQRDGIDWELVDWRLRHETLRNHDTRRAVSPRAVRRWLTAAAWFADVEPPRGFRDESDVRGRLTRLLGTQLRTACVDGRSAALANRRQRMREESAAAAFALGLQNGGHWQPWHRRGRRLVSSAVYQIAYRLSLPVA